MLDVDRFFGDEVIVIKGSMVGGKAARLADSSHPLLVSHNACQAPVAIRGDLRSCFQVGRNAPAS